MDKIKKLFIFMTFVLCAVVVIPQTSAAAGREIRFSDPTAKEGKDVDVDVYLIAPGESFAGGEFEVVYNPSMLEYKNGDAENSGNGTLKFHVTPGTANQEMFKLTFKALQTGESDILVNSYYVPTSTGALLDFSCGSSHITTEASVEEDEEKSDADASDTEIKEETPGNLEEGAKVTVDGQEYTIVDQFVDQVIPEGFKRTTTVIDGKEHGAVKQDDGEAVLVYLMRDRVGNFYYYSAADNSYSIVKSVEFLPNKYLLITNNIEGVKLPKEYKKVTFTCGDTKMPGWQSNNMPGFTIVRAIDKSGLPVLYKMDSQDGTFQRFVLPKEKNDNKVGGNLGKMIDYLEKNIEKVITGIWIFLVFIILVIVILACKLKNRNAEIIDLYDEFGVFEDNKKKKTSKKKNKKNVSKKEKVKKNKTEEQLFEDEIEDEMEPLFDDEPFFDSIDVDSVMPGHFDDYENLEDDFPVMDSTDQINNESKDDFNIEIMRID